MRNAGQWPLHECLVTDGWSESSAMLVQVIISRRRPLGGVAMASFLVDLGCLGVKDALANDNVSMEEYDEFIENIAGASDLYTSPPSMAVKLLETAVRYAASLGFRPAPEYRYCKEIFGDIDPGECDVEIPCGLNGKPVFFAGPYDDVAAILAQLIARLGADGFYVSAPVH